MVVLYLARGSVVGETTFSLVHEGDCDADLLIGLDVYLLPGAYFSHPVQHCCFTPVNYVMLAGTGRDSRRCSVEMY